MSVANCRVQYAWCFPLIPWYRQAISLIYGLGVILIALWALEQGQGPYVILGVVGMSFVTLMLIFGIEIKKIDVNLWNGAFEATIPFTNTSHPLDDDDDDDGETS